ncbi:MAG: hypothetical protein ACREPA_04200 [Candidatus Dormibacteraceae bacterium]
MENPPERRQALQLRAAVDRLLAEDLLAFVVVEGGRQPVPTERAADPADRNRVAVVVQAMAEHPAT